VRLAAVEALCDLGPTCPADALRTLGAALTASNELTRLHAADVVAALGAKARPVLPDVRRALATEPATSYPRKALTHVLGALDPPSR
jgi:hypothetical protein